MTHTRRLTAALLVASAITAGGCAGDGGQDDTDVPSENTTVDTSENPGGDDSEGDDEED